MSEQQCCYGCERSLSELMVEYNEITERFNKKHNRNDALIMKPEDVLEEPEIVFMDAGHWYCHPDCLSDCF